MSNFFSTCKTRFLQFLEKHTQLRCMTLSEFNKLNAQVFNSNDQNQVLQKNIKRLEDEHNTEARRISQRYSDEIRNLKVSLENTKRQLHAQTRRTEHLEQTADYEASKHQRENQSLLQQLNWLSGTIAHDFRAPLRAIDANCFFLKDDIAEHGPPDALDTVNEINRNGKRMAVLLDGLLDYLRIGIAPLHLTTHPLRELIEETLRNDFPEWNNRVWIEDPDKHLEKPTSVDDSLMHRMFKELLDNAIKFSQNAQPQPQVTIRSPSFNTLEIVDNGVGFNEDYQTQLFQLFHRLHTQAEFPGEGIGLCVAQRIALRHQLELTLVREGQYTIARLTANRLTH